MSGPKKLRLQILTTREFATPSEWHGGTICAYEMWGQWQNCKGQCLRSHFCKFLLNHKVHGNIRQPDALVHFLLPVQIDQMTRNTFTSILVLTLISQNMDFPFATVTSRSVWKWLSTYLAIPLTCCRLLTLKIVHYNDELAPIFFKENRAGTLLTIPPFSCYPRIISCSVISTSTCMLGPYCFS